MGLRPCGPVMSGCSGKKRDVFGCFGGKLWSKGIGGRPLGCNYPYECAVGEWTGPVWGSDSDQGDDCVGE